MNTTMTASKKAIQTVKMFLLSTAIVLTMVQCSEEEIIAEQVVEDDMATEMMSESADVASISVSGLYTEIKGDVQCSTCTYIVAASETTVDGRELGLRPGNIVCIKKSLKYPALDFVNMEGTEESPIIIGYCAE
jgi:hypothetical protein